MAEYAYEEVRNERTKQSWTSVMGSGTIEHRVIEGIFALERKGYDVSEAKAHIDDGNRAYEEGDWNLLIKIIAKINEALRRAPRMVCDYYKPETLQDIVCSLKPLTDLSVFPAKVDEETWYEKTHGGWMGKCIGVALGDPVAGWPTEKVVEQHGKISTYLRKPSTRNDDVTYPVLVLHAIEKHGRDFSSVDLGYEWVEHLIEEETYTAERRALRNLVNGIVPPYSAYDNNPFNIWIGAQMRGEVNGFLAPGNPRLAVELAHRDAIISHVNEGVYSEMFSAALISAAFVVDDIHELVNIGLSYVPPCSDFYHIVRQTVEWCERYGNAKEVVDRITENYSRRYHWIDTFPNIAVVIMALTLGERQFEDSILLSVNCGLDADCSTGQVGATVGTLLGEGQIPARWKNPIQNEVEFCLTGFERMRITDLVDWNIRMGKKFL